MNGLNIFISHHHEEKRLAKAWQWLINILTQGSVMPWYSSDDRVGGGTTPGEWRQEIRHEIERANVILVLITPLSNTKPWLYFESGFASGQSKQIIPITYFMKTEAINNVFQSLQSYHGDSIDDVMTLCGKLMLMHLGNDVPPEAKIPWRGWIEHYMEEVKEEMENSLARTLFHDHFHDIHDAQQLEGDWFAKWTQICDDGGEEIFEIDNVFVWTTDTRIRMVGMSSKDGREMLSFSSKHVSRHYPMEGVVSKTGWVALSYWSAGRIPICGTVLMSPKGSSGELLEGTWQGFTAKNINDTPAFAHGRMVMARNAEIVKNYWPHVR